MKFREQPGTLLTHLASKLFERAPLDSVAVRLASIFDPKIMIEYNHEKINKILRKLLCHLMSLNIISTQKYNKIVEQLTSLHKSVQSSGDKFTQFSRLSNSPDSFYFPLFPNLNQSFFLFNACLSPFYIHQKIVLITVLHVKIVQVILQIMFFAI